MQNSSQGSKDSEVIPRDDESEAQRLAEMRGVGETIYLDEEDIRGYSIADFNKLGPNSLGLVE